MACIGEKVWYLPTHGKGSILDPLCEEGIFLTILDRTDEIVLGVKGGIVKARDVRRRPLEERWDAGTVLGLQHSTLQPNGSDVDIRIKTILLAGLANPQVPQPPRDVPGGGVRRLRLCKSDFEDHGMTVGCPGCKQLTRAGGLPVNHSERCRSRVEDALSKTVARRARLEAVETKMTEAIADVIENKFGDSDKKRKAETEPVKANKEQRADIAVSNSQASTALLVARDAAMESAT
jgi:hypothetical protein